MKRFFVTLWLLLNPSWWLRLGHYCKEWDEIIGKALDAPECEVIIIDKYTAKINGYRLWIENYPYAYGRYYPSEMTEMQLSRYNTYRLRNIIEKNSYKYFD